MYRTTEVVYNKTWQQARPHQKGSTWYQMIKGCLLNILCIYNLLQAISILHFEITYIFHQSVSGWVGGRKAQRYLKKGTSRAKAPTQGGVWGREFLDSLTLGKLLWNSAKRLLRTQDFQVTERFEWFNFFKGRDYQNYIVFSSRDLDFFLSPCSRTI